MDKKPLLKLFEAQLEQLLATLTLSAKEAHAAATHSESKAEDQYDTRGLEASYLAGAQSRRALELSQTLDQFRFIDVKAFAEGDPILATALITLCDEEGRESLYRLIPGGGGMSVTWEGRKVQCLTPQSPMGELLLGRRRGDEFSLRIEGKERDFEIIEVR
jgi:transcription elongation GreA/GreB family factor